uniref:Uncharacterized protein n=1 Tax=viral metagenome TaxID=1070528 RepID=A0A6C0H883_9ZZZZ
MMCFLLKKELKELKIDDLISDVNNINKRSFQRS